MCTNVLERYARLQIVTHLRYGDRPVHILDVGCSLGLGLMALNTSRIQRANVGDPLLRRELESPVKARLIGLDVTRPTLKWAQACCLPQYMTQRSLIKQDYKTLRRYGSNFEFIQGDALELTQCGLAPASFDVVWTSNAFYEMEQSWIAPTATSPLTETQTVPSVVQHGAPITGGVVSQASTRPVPKPEPCGHDHELSR
jgi:hypothetical protein